MRLPSAGNGLLLAAFLGGFAAAAHELAWSRAAAAFSGNTSLGVAIALSGLMLGQAVGALAAGRLLHRAARNYPLLELSIGVTGCAATFLLFAVAAPDVFAPGALAALITDSAVAVAMTLPAAVAMGAVYPLLVRLGGARGVTAERLYFIGVAGAGAGVLTAATVSLPRWGVWGVCVVAVAGNVGAALVSRLRPPAAPVVPRPDGAVATDWTAVLRFGLVGGVGLAAQTVWSRVVVPYTSVSALSFAAIVAWYLVAQAAGAALARRRPDVDPDGWWSTALAVPVILVSLGVLRWMPEAAPDGGPLAALIAAMVSTGLCIAPASALLGIAQERVLDAATRASRAPATAAGRVVGFGTLIAATGPLLAFWLLPRLGPLVTLAVFAAPLFSFMAVERRARPALTCAGVLAGALLWSPSPPHFLGPSFDDTPALFVDVGPQDTVAVIERDLPVEPRIRRLVAGGVSFSGDSLFAQRYMRLLAHLPALSAREERAALVICVGTGTTVAALLEHRFGVVHAVDLSPSVLEATRLFRHVNAGFQDDDRVTVFTDDGLRFLRRGTRPYDVITLEPPPPRAPGAGALYSREFYEAARQRLAPGGVLAQWLPLHGLTEWEAALIVRTLLDAFPHVSLHMAERNEAVLLGSMTSTPPRVPTGPERLPRSLRDALEGIGVTSDVDPIAETLSAGTDALRRAAGTGPNITLAWPATELTPFAGPSRPAPLDRFLEKLAAAAPAGPTQGARLLRMAAAFIRMREGSGSATDRASVQGTLLELARRSGPNPYVQHMFGYGALLEARVARLRAGGHLDDAEVERVLMRIRQQRTRFEESLAQQ